MRLTSNMAKNRLIRMIKIIDYVGEHPGHTTTELVIRLGACPEFVECSSQGIADLVVKVADILGDIYQNHGLWLPTPPRQDLVQECENDAD